MIRWKFGVHRLEGGVCGDILNGHVKLLDHLYVLSRMNLGLNNDSVRITRNVCGSREGLLIRVEKCTY